MINIKEELLVERIVNRQLKANERILIEMGETLAGLGDLTSSQAYTIAQQLKYGESLDKIVKILSETSNLTEEEIYEILEKSAKNNLALSERYFKAKKIDFIPYDKNIALQNKVKEIARATIDSYRNISSTTGIKYLDSNGNEVVKDIKEAYNELIDSSIENIALGKETFGEMLIKQLETITSNGIRSIEYESGRSRRIDSAIRMNIQDGLNQLSLAQQQIVGEQFGNDGWEITVHDNSAEDHEDLQGHILTNEEFEKLQDYSYVGEIKDINNNVYIRKKEGSPRPIGELNCYHRAFAIIIGIDKPIYSEEELEKIKKENKEGFEYEGKHYTMYEATQVQRRFETEIRRNREEKIMLKSAYESSKDDSVKESIKEQLEINKQRESELLLKYDDFSKSAGLEKKLERTRVIQSKADPYLVKTKKIEPKTERYEDKTVSDITSTKENTLRTFDITEEKEKKDWMKEKNLPGWYSTFNGYEDEGKELVKFLNTNGNKDSLASKVFSKHVKDLGHTSNGMVRSCFTEYKEGKGQFKRDTWSNTLTIPKISDKENKIGSVNTTLHENFHAIDYYKGEGVHMTDDSSDLSSALIADDGSIGNEVQERFDNFNQAYTEVGNEIRSEYHNKFLELEQLKSDEGWDYDKYKRRWNKLNKEEKLIKDYERRNLLGGGYDLLQDIYDALSGGKLLDTGKVKYGHGMKYFKKNWYKKGREIFADYCALNITNPELAELLKKDKPRLCKALDSILKDMMK